MKSESKRMQKTLTFVLLAVTFLSSCEEDASILQLEDNLNRTTILFIDENLEEKTTIISEYTDVKDKLSKTYTIVGNKGGKIIEKHTWTNGIKRLKLEAYLTIPKGAFEDTLIFDMVFDPNLLSVEFHPTPFTFNVPIILDLKYKGIDEDFEIDPDSLDFKYYKLDGTFEDVNYKNILWNFNSRTLTVKDAELHHFSRYGWTRTKTTDK